MDVYNENIEFNPDYYVAKRHNVISMTISRSPLDSLDMYRHLLENH